MSFAVSTESPSARKRRTAKWRKSMDGMARVAQAKRENALSVSSGWDNRRLDALEDKYAVDKFMSRNGESRAPRGANPEHDRFLQDAYASNRFV